MLVVAGMFTAPYLVYLTARYIGGPDWFGYLVVIVVGLVLYAVGIEMVRMYAIGMILGVIAVGAVEKYAPRFVNFLGVDLPEPF
jgi:hypothetical protein